MNSTSKIELSLRLLGTDSNKLIPIAVKPYDSIFDLKNNSYELNDKLPFDISSFSFFLNGSKLSPAFSFSFYNVKDGDIIDVIPESQTKPNQTNNHEGELSKMRKKKQMVQIMRDRLRWAINQNQKGADKIRSLSEIRRNSQMIPVIVTETSKLADLMRQRIENTPEAFRKILSNYKIFTESTNIDSPEDRHFYPTIVPPIAQAPSIDVLPFVDNSQYQ